MAIDKPYIREIYLKDDKSASADVHPFDIPAINRLGRMHFHPDVTFFVGENGAGKSTLLEGIAVALGFNPEGGNFSVNFSTVDSVSSLHQYLRVVRGVHRPKDGYFLRAESFFNVATYYDEGPALKGFGNKSIHSHSHGEAFMSLIVNQFKGNGIYILDEPEAALSPSRQMTAIRAIDQWVNEGSQFIIATHSPLLLSYPRSRIYQFDEEGVSVVDYEDTDCFRLTRDFLNNHERRLQQLLR
ncbi:Predicted ATPase [Pseudomonas flavescens]|uniref:Predicted ATPase n=1 Tax=Phytopseudomonas flavescens TaxID=29435 RepID=A0A1G8F0L1_9GAMM|nr:AAA family ATPase [Pseudomonas flavescens]SDH75673.1 Predicted ATPase [Pseudomonas flavescens]